jgi:RNA polymerase sigma factor (sigma-70 family)
MKKKEAGEKLEQLYNSTYDDAIAYIAAATGTLDKAEEILTETYFEIYKYFISSKVFNNADMQEYFFKTIRKSIEAHSEFSKETIEVRAKIRRTMNSVEKMLNTELDIEIADFFKANMNKEIYAYIMKSPAPIRRIFLLYFYCGYDAERIATLLQMQVNEVSHLLYTLLKDLRDGFLKGYITKVEIKL